MEASAASGVSERLVAFTVARSDHPEEFAKLGVMDAVLQPDGSTEAKPRQMVFLIDAPEETRWFSSYVTEVETLLVPFPGAADEQVEVVITKDTDSLFVTDDGMKVNAVRFQHASTSQNFDY